MKKVFVIDLTLIPAFLFSAVSGVLLHASGHGGCHGVWHNWAVAHISASVLFLLPVALHVKTHMGWYKGLVKKGIGSKSRLTLLLTLLFAVVCFSGIALLFVCGAGSHIGLWHYAAGLVLIAVSLVHFSTRLRLLLAAARKKSR